MIELKDFMYELGRYAEHMHILKDSYQSLSKSEKEFIMEEAPDELSSPEERFLLIHEWMENLHKRLGIENRE